MMYAEIPDRIPPMLRFNDDEGVLLYECHWIGGWPPPEAFRVYIGTRSGIVKVMPDDEPPNEAERAALAADSIHFALYIRESCSRITDDEIRDAPNVMRGAVYRRRRTL